MSVNVKVVIGLGYGDEGKGITTDFLCSTTKNPLVVRFSGGGQAGHTVLHNDIRHIFSNFGSGTLRGVPTYWSKFCTVSPNGIFNEYEILKNKGINPILWIDKDCPVITPYDQFHNQKDQSNREHGTCGIGFGATVGREEKNFHLHFSDLFYPFVLKTKMEMIQSYYKTDIDLTDFYSYCHFLTDCKMINMTDRYIMWKYETLIFEGSQGLLLDKDIGFFPHVTRSNTGTRNINELISYSGCNFGPDNICLSDTPEIYMVTRAYTTRHGNGPMSGNDKPHNIKIDPLETNVNNKYQGEFKRTLLDTDLLNYAILKEGHLKSSHFIKLVITCLDHIVNEYRFIADGQIVYCTGARDFIKKVALALKINHLYQDIYISHTADSKNITKFNWD